MREHMSRRRFLGESATAALGGAMAAAAVTTGRPAAARAAGAKTGRLKKALLWGMIPGKMPIDDRFKLAADLGFDGIEAPTIGNEKTVEAMRAGAERAGIRIHSIMNTGHWQNPLSSDNPQTVRKSLDIMRTSLRNAKAFGADVVLLVPAVVNAGTRYKDAYVRSQKAIRELLPQARELGVVIAIENVWNKFLLSPLEFARYIDEFNDPYLQGYFDVGNIVLYGYPQDWILTLGKRIKKVHLKDFDAKKRRFVPLREGSVDWPVVRKALDEIGYEGFLTTEVAGGDRDHLAEIARRVDLIIAGK